MDAAPYSIVVVTWNCAHHLRALVASMNEHLDADHGLVVVDNGSSDDPERAARGWKGPLDFVPLGENRGFAAASNAGVGRVDAPVTVLLNPDTELLDSGLDRLAATAASRAAIVGPRVMNTDGSPQPSASGPETGAWPWLRALLPGALAPAGVRRYTEPYRLERPAQVAWLTGACIAGPTELLRELGPFDPALHLYGEDIDLGLRAGAAGIPVWFDPAACRVVHHGQGSSTLAYGSREGWRPQGTVHWRAALRRAYGPRREWLAWRALRLNLRLRLLAKLALGRATDRDHAALRAAIEADPVPELPPATAIDRPRW